MAQARSIWASAKWTVAVRRRSISCCSRPTRSRSEHPVIGCFVRQFTNRAQPDVNRGRRKTLLLERGAVALDGGLRKALGGVHGGPDVEVIESLAVSPAGVGRGKRVEDEGFQLVPGSDCGLLAWDFSRSRQHTPHSTAR